MCAWCRYTRGRFERTHGDVLNPHTGSRGSWSVLLTKICPRTETSGWSIALFSKHNLRCESQYRHKPPPAFALLRQGSPSFKSRHSFSYSNHFQHNGIHTFSRTYKNTHTYSYTFTYINFKNICIYIYMCHHESIVTDATTFEMELCGCKQTTTHAHLQAHGVCD